MIKEKKTKVNTVFTCSAKAMNRYREDAQREQRGQGVKYGRQGGWQAHRVLKNCIAQLICELYLSFIPENKNVDDINYV